MIVREFIFILINVNIVNKIRLIHLKEEEKKIDSFALVHGFKSKSERKKNVNRQNDHSK